MKHLKYERLLSITRDTYPYKGTKEYPIHCRHYGHKRFEAVEVEKSDGTKELEFHVYYGYTYDTKAVSYEEYNAAMRQRGKVGWPKTYQGYDSTSNTKSYHVTTRTRTKVGIVRSDNTFEFVKLSYFHQGICSFLSSWTERVWRSSRQGGIVLRSSYKMHPVFAGLRVNIDTLEPHESCNYVLYKTMVNRNKGHAARKKYEKQMKIAQAMFSAMDRETMISQLRDVSDEAKVSNVNYYMPKEDKILLADYVLHNLENDPVGAFMARILLDNTLYVRQYVRGAGSGYYSKMHPIEYFNLVKKSVLRSIYIGENGLDEEAIPMGSRIPSSRWNFKLTLNDVEVNQFK